MRSIIIYYSYGGNTKKIAEMIHKNTGAEMAEIKTVTPYKGSYNSVVEQGHKEVNRGYMPEIMPLEIDINNYDKIFLGTPVWWYTFAPAVKTFLNNNDFNGKTICPFITNGGWIGHTEDDIKNVCSNACVKKAINIKFNGSDLSTSVSEINKWIESNKN